CSTFVLEGASPFSRLSSHWTDPAWIAPLLSLAVEPRDVHPRAVDGDGAPRLRLAAERKRKRKTSPPASSFSTNVQATSRSSSAKRWVAIVSPPGQPGSRGG